MFLRILNALVTTSGVISAAALVLMMLTIVADVLSVNLIGRPIPTVSAVVTSYFMVLVVFLPLALAQKLDGHVVVDVVHQHMPPRLRRVVDRLTALITLVVCVALTRATWADAMAKTQISAFIFEQNVRVPTWPGYYALPVGFGLMAVVIFALLIRSFTAPAPAVAPTETTDGK